MTKHECAIVTLHTGINMLEGDDLRYLYEYASGLIRGNYRTGYVDTIHRNCPECLQRIDWTEGEG